MYTICFTIAIQITIILIEKEYSMATKSANVMARVGPDVKSKAEAILANLGIPTSVAINAFYHQIIYNNGLPFSLNIPTNIDSEENMNDEELDSMFLKALEEINNGESRQIEEVLKSLREDIKHGKV